LDENSINKESIDLIITSPPYNIGMEYDAKEGDNLVYEKYLEFSES
jgi:site-specific DNA-methyltransferase (adenine-specific)